MKKNKMFQKKLYMWYILSCLVTKPGGHMTEIFSVGIQKTDTGLKAKLNL